MPQLPVKTTLFTSQVKVGPGLTVTPTSGTGVITLGLESAGTQHQLVLTDVKADDGLPMLTATAASTIPGIARTAGTSIALTGVATSGAQTVTTYMLWGFVLPGTYVAGANISVAVNCVATPATDLTPSTTTMTVAAYSVVAGVETALTVSAAQEMPVTTAATLTFTVTGTGLTPGEYVELELAMAVTTTSGGASSGFVYGVTYTA